MTGAIRLKLTSQPIRGSTHATCSEGARGSISEGEEETRGRVSSRKEESKATQEVTAGSKVVLTKQGRTSWKHTNTEEAITYRKSYQSSTNVQGHARVNKNEDEDATTHAINSVFKEQEQSQKSAGCQIKITQEKNDHQTAHEQLRK